MAVRGHDVFETHLAQLVDRSRSEPVATGLLAREVLLLDQTDRPARLGEPVRAGRTRRSRADDDGVEDVAVSRPRRAVLAPTKPRPRFTPAPIGRRGRVGLVEMMSVDQYLPILGLLVLGVLFGAGSLVMSAMLAPRKRPSDAKLAPYECGIVPEIEPPQRFPVRFYLVAMIFVIFDIEVVFLYPFAVVFRQLGLFGLVEVAGLFR